jgi:hypothetical protein
LSPAEGRRFGFTVGGAFLLLAALLVWRGVAGVAAAAAILGVLLALGALLAPGELGPVRRAWMGLALLLSKVTTPVFMGVVYFGVILPVGLVRRALGRRPLQRRADAASFWIARDPAASHAEHMRHLF